MYKLYFVNFVKLKSILFLHTRSIYHSLLSLFITWSSRFFLFFPDPPGVVQRAGPSYNPRGTCPRWADTLAVPGWAEPRSRQFQAHGSKRIYNYMGGNDGDNDWALALAIYFLSFFFFFFPLFLLDSLLFSSTLLTSARSCNGHAPPINQEGRARAGQIPQPRQDGQSPNPNSS
jgi:hypothetical protein